MKAYIKSDYDFPQSVLDDIDMLERTFLKSQKRKMKIELFFSSGGETERPLYEMTAHYDEASVSEVEWAIEQLT